MRKLIPIIFIVSILCCLIAETSQSQVKQFERRKWINNETTTVTDDTRRLPIPPDPKGPEGTTVLRGGRIFDASGADIFIGSIVLEHNKIKKILEGDSQEWPDDATVIDVSGKTVMPGLIDMHVHLTTFEPGVPPELHYNLSDATLRGIERMRYWIECGVTSVRDLCAPGDVPFRLKQWSAQNRIPGPRVFPVGQLITGTGGHGAEGRENIDPFASEVYVADGPHEWRKAVRVQFNRGADWIKVGSHYSREEIAAAVDEAHTLGLKVSADAETFYIQWAVEAGADCIEHPLPRSDETIKMMVEKGTEAIPTLIPYIFIFDIAGNYFGTPSRRFTFSKAANLNVLRRMKEAGVKLGLGTDLTFDWFRHLPDAYITEMKQYLAVGYTAPEVLMTATRINAEILDMGDKLGTLTPGKLADVIVINGKPDKNIDELANVELVIRDGWLVVKNGRVFVPRHPHRTGTPKGWIDR